LSRYITSGPFNVAILKKENAVQLIANLSEPPILQKAAEGTIRHKFGTNIEQNAVLVLIHDEKCGDVYQLFFSETAFLNKNTLTQKQRYE
jgi:nucleoside diphosphate kinase